MTRAGEPFTAAGFTGWFRDRCKEAGLPSGLSAHGLRKAACRRLAEARINKAVHQIKAVSGHASLKEVQRYTKAADQKRMATDAMAVMAGTKGGENCDRTGKPGAPNLKTLAQGVEKKGT
jgi:integrase